MKRSLLILLLSLLFSTQLAFGQLFGNGSGDGLQLSAPAELSPTFEWETDSYDFGEILKGKPVTHTFTFTNTGKAELQIENVKPSCSCSVADYSKEAIAPGEAGFVEVEYAAKNTGMFHKTFTVLSNTGKPVILRIKGEVKE